MSQILCIELRIPGVYIQFMPLLMLVQRDWKSNFLFHRWFLANQAVGILALFLQLLINLCGVDFIREDYSTRWAMEFPPLQHNLWCGEYRKDEYNVILHTSWGRVGREPGQGSISCPKKKIKLKKKGEKKGGITSYASCKCLMFAFYWESWLKTGVFLYFNTMLK